MRLGDLVNSGTALEDEQLPALMRATVVDEDPLRVIVPAIDGGKHALGASGGSGLSAGDVVHVMLDELGNVIVVSPSGGGGGGGYNPPIPQSDVTNLVADLAAKVDDDDARLSDARTPTAHTHAQSDVDGLTDALASGGMPPGGDVGEVLTKQSSSDGDAGWEAPGGPGAWHIVGDPGEPAFQNGWSNYGGATSGLKFRHLPAIDSVQLVGAVKGGTANLPLFTLPVGLRPASQTALQIPSIAALFVIEANGDVWTNYTSAAHLVGTVPLS